MSSGLWLNTHKCVHKFRRVKKTKNFANKFETFFLIYFFFILNELQA